MTTLVHGEEATRSVELASQALFGRAELAELDEKTLAAALQEASVADIEAGAPNTIIDLLVATGLSESKGAARRAVKEGGASVNNIKISDEDWKPTADDLLHGQLVGGPTRKAKLRGCASLRLVCARSQCPGSHPCNLVTTPVWWVSDRLRPGCSHDSRVNDLGI